MKIYDVEVLDVAIGVDDIAEMLVTYQHDIVEQNLKVIKLEKDLDYTKKAEEIVRLKLDEQIKTNGKKTEVALINETNENKVLTSQFTNAKTLEAAKLDAESEKQETIDAIKAAELTRQNNEATLRLGYDKEKSALRIKEVEAEMAAITPGLIEAIVSMNDVKLADTLARNLKEQKGAFSLGDLFGKSGGFEGLLETVKGTPIYDKLLKIHEDYKKMKATPKTE